MTTPEEEMPQQMHHALAHCEDCDKTYRVPNPDHAYACKTCGRTLQVEHDPSQPHLVGALTCPECQAINHQGTRFCTECNTALEAELSELEVLEPEAPVRHLVGALTCPECQAINHQGTRFCTECNTALGAELSELEVLEPEAPVRHLVGALTCPECQAINHQGTRFCTECNTALEAALSEEEVLEPEATVHHLVGALTCPKCSAINHHGTHFCAECSTALGAPLTVQKDAVEERERREATNALRHAFKTIAGVAWLYRLGALAYALVTVIAIFALSRTGVPRGPGLLVVGLSTLLTVLMLLGALQISFKPFVWTLIVASLASLVSVAHLIGPNPLGLAFYWSAAWAVAFWLAVLPTLQFRRLIRNHTDLYITLQASRTTKRAIEGHAAAERHERLLRVMQSAFRRSWKISAVVGGLICVASALGSYGVLTKLRPGELSTTLEDFQSTWNSGDTTAVAAFFAPQLGARETARLAGYLDGHGWRGALPRMDGTELREGDDERRWADHELGDVAMATCWMLEARTWYLTEVELPIPPLEPSFERFLEAWRNSDVKAIAAFYPPDYVERMTASIERSASYRKWDRFPDILDTVLSDVTERKAVATLTVDSGEVIIKWLFRASGRWSLQGIEFPKR